MFPAYQLADRMAFRQGIEQRLERGSRGGPARYYDWTDQVLYRL
jgi:hypothetical protein